MPKFKKSFHIKGRDFIRAGEASINVQNLLKSMDFDPRLTRRIAICGYESEMNVVMHGGDGSLSVEVDSNKLILEVRDDGPGIDGRPTTTIAKWASERAWDCRI
jgi:anti-sigma regulatory factor (Ser/Thr protein kinase)